MPPNMAVELAGIRMKNPVMAASGTFGFGQEYAPLVDLNQMGAIVVKSVTLNPTAGNPPPRLCETPSGMLNSIGLMNPGLDVFLAEKLPALRGFQVPVIVNIAGKTVDEYRELARRLDQAPGVAGLEVNISCPNVKEGGAAFGADPLMAARVTGTVRGQTRLPVIVKLSPNVTDITVIARAAEEAGADALSLINTLAGMAIDAERRLPVLGNVAGGLSGPAVKPVALHMVWRVAGVVHIPVIGMGGIFTGLDAVEFMLAGARAVATGVSNFVEPRSGLLVAEGIKEYLIRHGIPDVRHLVGALNRSK